MTVSADVSGCLSAVSWSDDQLYLKEFVHKHDLPAIVRIVKGQYCNLGVSGISNPSLQSTILLMGLGRKRKILAQSIKFKDNRRVVPVGPKLAVPSSFEGYFELLSEDGRSVRCIESVGELSRRFPDAVLVREGVRAFVSKSDDVESIEERSRVVEAGETLLLVGEVVGVRGRARARFLRCFDRHGENVYLPLELRGKFSAIAKEDNISGVHSAENIMTKRLPLMARLVHGLPPVGLKSSQQFLPEVRLFTTADEEALVAMTLSPGRDNAAVIPLPLPANLKLHYATNMGAVGQSKEFMRLRERCHELSHHLTDRIVVHDIVLARDLRINGADLKQRVVQNIPGNNKPTSAANNGGSRRSGIYGRSGSDEYDEIEQIYDYVRGFAPLPKAARGWRYEPPPPPTKTNSEETPPVSNSSDLGGHSTSPTPPEPPPLETLPSRKHQSHHQPMDVSLSPTVVFSPPPWGIASYGHTKHDSQHIYEASPVIVTVPKQPEAKKRQRHSAEKSSSKHEAENRSPQQPQMQPHVTMSATPTPSGTTTTTTRFIKSANYRSIQTNGGSGYKHRFFRNRSSGASSKDSPSPPQPLTPSHNAIYSPLSQLQAAAAAKAQSPMFQLRYKSMTNLAAGGPAGEYDTLDSSNSGGKTSAAGDSGGSSSARQPEKRSRKLSRPKSLTNLVWGSAMRSASRQSLNAPAENESKRRLEPGVYTHRRLSRDLNSPVHHPSPALMHGKKLGGSKRIGTLYL